MAKKREINFVLDSSVVIKWFSEEEDTDKALLIREQHILQQKQIIVPDLLIYEIANALRYNPTIKEQDVQEAVKSIINLGITLFDPITEITNKAINLAFKYQITVYDAYFLALAKVLKCKFITADEKLYNKTKGIKNIQLLKDYQ